MPAEGPAQWRGCDLASAFEAWVMQRAQALAVRSARGDDRPGGDFARRQAGARGSHSHGGRRAAGGRRHTHRLLPRHLHAGVRDATLRRPRLAPRRQQARLLKLAQPVLQQQQQQHAQSQVTDMRNMKRHILLLNNPSLGLKPTHWY